MKTKKVIESALDEIEGYEFLFFTDADTGEQEYAKEHPEDAAKVWSVSKQCVLDLVTAFDFMRDELIRCIKADLKDTWEKLE